MATYTNAQALAARLIAAKGFAATVRAASTPADPLTGLGGADGASRTVNAVQTRIDYRTFPEGLVRQGDRMFIFAGPVAVGEYLIDGSDEWPIRETMRVEPDNASHIITKALVGG